MKQTLVDVNVLLALVSRNHRHHAIANAWFDRQQAGEVALCRLVQLGVVRLLSRS